MRILLTLPEFPFAHYGGAARSLRTMAEWMAARGHQAQCVAPMTTDRYCDARQILADLGAGDLERFDYRGVSYRLARGGRPAATVAKGLDERFLDSLISFKPDLVLGYGGQPSEERRFDYAKRHGAKLVLGLRNFGYTSKLSFFSRFDGILTCSRFLRNWYSKEMGVRSTALPVPIAAVDAIAETREPKYFTFINPARRKGSAIMAAAFRALKASRPDIPLLVVGESNEPEFSVLAECADTLPWQTNPKMIYARTKVLLVPSIWEEPAGRVIVEAMLNRIRPVISDRGGMPETANGGGYVLPLDPRFNMLTAGNTAEAPAAIARPWVDQIIELHDAGAPFCEVTDMAARMYRAEELAPQYEAYFESVLSGRRFDAGAAESFALPGVMV